MSQASRNVCRFTFADRRDMAEALAAFYRRPLDGDGDPADACDDRLAGAWSAVLAALHVTYHDLRQSERDQIWSAVEAADETWIAR